MGLDEQNIFEAWRNPLNINGCLVAKMCLILLQPHGLCSLTGFSVKRNSQAKILEWVDISFSRGSSQPVMEHTSPTLASEFFTIEPQGKLLFLYKNIKLGYSQIYQSNIIYIHWVLHFSLAVTLG